MTIVLRRAAVVMALLALTACTLPDVSPFVDASMEVRAGTTSAGDTLLLELQAMEKRPEIKDALKELQQPPPSETFQAAWVSRLKAANAMVAYANSLRAIVDAGMKGRDNAESLAQAVETLGDAAGIMPGGKPALDIAEDAFKFIVAQVALIRARSSLKEALVAGDPAVQKIARLLKKDLVKVDEALRIAAQALRNSPKFEMPDNLKYRAKLEKARKDIYASETLTPEQEKRLIEIDAQLRATDSWYLPYLADRKAGEERLRAGRQLIAKCAQVLDEWAEAHGQLTVAVRDGYGVSVESLMRTAGEIETLVKRIQQP